MFGKANISLVQVRAEPSSKSELTTQLLYGETYTVTEENNEWLKIKTVYDEYEGWININQYDEAAAATLPPLVLTQFPLHWVKAKNLYLLTGSNVNAQDFNQLPTNLIAAKHITAFAQQFLGAPYLWGGRSFLGIDCSGFTQVVYKCAGIKLSRDASMQATQGLMVDFLSMAEANDLAFFCNSEDQITHVGILLNNQKIIHASGQVRIDDIDSYGIFNQNLNKHTHQLKFIKRIM